jgi:hypothetical protein
VNGAEWLLVCTCGDAEVLMLVPNGSEHKQAGEAAAGHLATSHAAEHTCRVGPVAGTAQLRVARVVNWLPPPYHP